MANLACALESVAQGKLTAQHRERARAQLEYSLHAGS